MLKLEPSTKYKKDYRNISKSGKLDEDELKKVVTSLMKEQALDAKYKDHKLTGPWDGYRDCHVQNDIVLIYKVEGQRLLLTRLNTHAKLFG